jgi:ADP-ribose pyrophosphatase
MTPPLIPQPPEGQSVYQERRFSLRVCELPLSDGQSEHRGVVIHPGAVVILAIDADGSLVLIRNHRWQVGQRILELPAGTLEPEEDPRICALRELEEETGYRALEIEHLHSFYPLPGGSTEVMHAFIARDLTHVGQSLMPDEDIVVERLSESAAKAALVEGSIVDSKTMAILGLYFLKSSS